MTLAHLLTGTLVALAAATLVGQILRRRMKSEPSRLTIANMNARIASWWVLCGLTALALMGGTGAVCLEFALFSTLAVRELLPQRRNYLLVAPAIHYFLIVSEIDAWAAVLPIGGLLLIAGWNLFAPDARPYVARTTEEYAELLIAVWFPSFAPALLTLEISGYQGRNPMLLFYLLLVVESSDILQYIWGKLLGRHPVAPRISPNKTWEGLLGGVLSATALGAALYRATPFGPAQAAAICFAISLAGFLGGLTMSAIKRRRGIKDFGTLIPGHGGMLDRMDSLCFAAPVFYLLVRYGVAR